MGVLWALDQRPAFWMPSDPLSKPLSPQMARPGTHLLCCPCSLSPEPPPSPQNAWTRQVESLRHSILLPQTLAPGQSRVVLTSHERPQMQPPPLLPEFALGPLHQMIISSPFSFQKTFRLGIPRLGGTNCGSGAWLSQLSPYTEAGRHSHASRTAATHQMPLGSMGKPTSHWESSRGCTPPPSPLPCWPDTQLFPFTGVAGGFDSGLAACSKRLMGRTEGAEEPRQPSECCPEMNGPSLPEPLWRTCLC